jgi:galactoside O-acetyltransferase
MNTIDRRESFKDFFFKKFVLMPWRQVVFYQIESICFWIFDGLPGFPGMALRNVVYRALFKRISGFAWIHRRVTFVESNKLSLGKMFYINSGSYIHAMGGVEIGDYVMIGPNVTISTGWHPIAGRFPEMFARPTESIPIVIEDDVWIGAGAVVMPGVRIRKGSVIGANSVVMHDTEPYSVVAGSPARKIQSRSIEPDSRGRS